MEAQQQTQPECPRRRDSVGMRALVSRARILLAMAVLGVSVSLVTTSAPAVAARANGGVYGILAPRDRWCSHPKVFWANETTGQIGSDLSGKDDIFWLPLRLNTPNLITLAVDCGFWGERDWYGTVRATRTRQSVFFRFPSGYTLK